MKSFSGFFVLFLRHVNATEGGQRCHQANVIVAQLALLNRQRLFAVLQCHI